jgi:uncharacterized phage protein (TIGR02220 family)
MVIYDNQIDALEMMEAEDFKKAVLAMARYAMKGELPEVSGIAGVFFQMAKPAIDSNNQKYENGKKGGNVSGQVRTKPKQNEPNVKQNEPNTNQTEPNVNQTSSKCKLLNVNGELKNEKGELLKDNKNTLSDKSDHARTYPYAEVISYLNQKAGTAFKVNSKDTRKHIKARFDEGFTVEDFKTVIDHKVTEWGSNPDMAQYLRPSTLFGTKFESYLNQKVVKPSQVKSKNKFCNFPQREYDWDNLETEMLKNGLGEA